MPDRKVKKKSLKRVLKLVLTLLALGLAGLLAWIVLVPMITAGAVTTYDSFTVDTGDISTTKSFSASLSVKKSETFASTEQCTVRGIYVQSGDEVKKGDQLALLSTGELFTASFDGVVNQIRVSVGDWLWPNFTVVQVNDLTHLEVAMNVDEYDVESLAVGQDATISVISLGIDFETVIAHINRVSQSQGTVAYYAVTCDLTVPENVLPGMQATVTLPAESVTQVTRVDMAALAFDEQKQPYVLLKDESGAYVQTPVETGLSDGMTVEVKSGLSPGQTVYAVTGSESIKPTFTLTDLYTMFFGTKTVINDMSERSGPGGQSQGAPPDGAMPEGTAPSGDMPALNSTTGSTASEGQTAAEATASDGQISAGDQSTDSAAGVQEGANLDAQ